MINYVAHWDRILIQSRSQIIDELNNHEFRSICPIVNKDKLKNHYDESLHWDISREKFFDFSSVISLKKILNDTNDGSIFHVFTLKTGFLFMLSYLITNKKFKVTLSITGLGYFFSNHTLAKLFKNLLRPLFIVLINKTFDNIIYQNLTDQSLFNNYSRFKNNTYLIESSGINSSDYILKNNFNADTKIILAGRLLKDKGIESFINLSNEFSSHNVSFYLAGELDLGNPKSLTEYDLADIKANSSINYLGYIDLPKEICNFDLLLSLSDHEGFSRVVVEALYVGLFVIAFENNGTKFIKDFDNSSLLKSKDIGLLKKEIYKFLNSNKSISTENRKNIEKKYSTKNIASKFDEIYNDNVDG